MFRRDLKERLDTALAIPGLAAADHELDDALGTSLPDADMLADEIAADLDPVNFGVGWWKGQLGDKRRILISDYLLQCAVSIPINLAEAGLHLAQVEHAADEQATQLARIVTERREFKHPIPGRAADLVAGRLLSLHLAGFFRALGSALDCLAGVLVGVTPLEGDILAAGYKAVRGNLKGLQPPTTVAAQLRYGVKQALFSAEANGGPAGWIDWVIDYRNMLVHRGRRLQLGAIDVKSHVLNEFGDPIPRSTPQTLLARDPASSDVEAFFDFATIPNGIPVLTENALVTTRGALDSTRGLLSTICKVLLDVWKTRRATPSLAPQPTTQWPNIRATGRGGFRGYAPGGVSFTPSQMMLGKYGDRRLASASLAAGGQSRWSTFTD